MAESEKEVERRGEGSLTLDNGRIMMMNSYAGKKRRCATAHRLSGERNLYGKSVPYAVGRENK